MSRSGFTPFAPINATPRSFAFQLQIHPKTWNFFTRLKVFLQERPLPSGGANIPDGEYTLEYRSVDKVGHIEAMHSLEFKVDSTPPVISGMPEALCTIWPPNNKLVQIATVKAADSRSGMASGSFVVEVDSNEPVSSSDIVIKDGVVQVRAQRSGKDSGRVYTVTSKASDIAGNTALATATCTVPHDQGHSN